MSCPLGVALDLLRSQRGTDAQKMAILIVTAMDAGTDNIGRSEVAVMVAGSSLQLS
jgi:hypothetical protein